MPYYILDCVATTNFPIRVRAKNKVEAVRGLKNGSIDTGDQTEWAMAGMKFYEFDYELKLHTLVRDDDQQDDPWSNAEQPET